MTAPGHNGIPADVSQNRSILALAEQLVRCADAALLDTPLDALGARVHDDEARALLRELYEAGEASSLRELLEPRTLERWAFEVATPQEGQTLRAELRRMLGVGHFGDDDPARLVTVAALPKDVDAIVAWAKPYGLLGELARPASEVLLDAGTLVGGSTVLECSLGLVTLPRGASLVARSRIEDQARAHLVREAATHGAASARRALWSAPCTEDFRPLVERLRACVGETSFAELHAVGFVPARLVVFDPRTGIARGVVRGAEDTTRTVRLFLAGFEQRAITGECETCERAGCLHVRALAARLLDACASTTDRLHATLAGFVAVPSWKTFLRALAGPDDDAHVARDERLQFRLRVTRDRVSVAVVQRRALGNGRFSAGKLVSPQDARRMKLGTERDRPVLEAMAFALRAKGAQYVLADLALLRALVEHTGVVLEGSDELVHVREERITVKLVEQADGLLPRPSLGGSPVETFERPRDATYVLAHARATSTLVFAALTPSLSRLLSALASFRGVLPPESHRELSPLLAAIGRVADVQAPKSLRGTERPVPRRLLLRITNGLDEGIDALLCMRPLPLSPLFPPGGGPELVHGVENGVQVHARRELAEERALAARLIETLGLDQHLRLEPFHYRVERTQDALTVLSAAARATDELAIEWAEPTRAFTLKTSIVAGDLKVNLFRKGQWWSVRGGVQDPARDVGIARLLDAARRGERFVPITGTDFVEIERDLFERLSLAQLCTNESLTDASLATAALPLWLEALGDQTHADEPRWLEHARPHPIARVDVELGTTLRSYQQEGLDWLADRSRFAPGACLADEMGLGKTVQTIGLLVLRAALGPALVIAPTSVVSNWTTELARFAPKLRVIAYVGADREKRLDGLGANDVVVTSYELLLRDIERFAPHGFATEVIDEAQVVKNARTHRARAVARIDAAFRVALTGTPVENRLGDLWSLFHLVAPGLLGSWPRFRARFAVPIERYEREDRAAALRSLVSPFVLRRTKERVAAELPSRTELVHLVELSPAERDLYDGAVREAQRAIGRRKKHETNRTVQILAELTRLRQLACHPRLVLDDTRLESSKLAAFLEILSDILPRGHRALVFSQFTKHLALVREALDARGLHYQYLDGSTPGEERAARVSRFQAGEGQLFLISLKAGGTGLNLTGADYVIHLDPWWNPAAEDQASDRAHRLGQARPVTIVKLVAEGTIEEKVLELHAHKRRLADAVLEGTESALPLDQSALEALLAIGG